MSLKELEKIVQWKNEKIRIFLWDNDSMILTEGFLRVNSITELLRRQVEFGRSLNYLGPVSYTHLTLPTNREV